MDVVILVLGSNKEAHPPSCFLVNPKIPQLDSYYCAAYMNIIYCPCLLDHGGYGEKGGGGMPPSRQGHSNSGGGGGGGGYGGVYEYTEYPQQPQRHRNLLVSYHMFNP